VIVAMPGVKLSPETVLARVLEEKPVAVIVVYKKVDGTFDCDSSTMPMHDLVYGLTQLDEQVRHECFRRDT
jgi:hypothetical protein